MMNSAIGFGSSRRVRHQVTLPPPKPKVLAAWLEELPLANAMYCYDAVEAVLKYFNGEASIPPAVRLELANLLRPTVCLLTRQAETHFMDAPLPYHPKANFYAGLAFLLQEELAMAYALAAFETKPAQGWFNHGEHQLLNALYRALQHMGMVLLRTAQRYLTPQPDYWSTLFRLYRLAEERNLLAAHFEDSEEPDACKTPLGVFKRGLLFDLASTRHLRQREMSRVYELLGTLADHAKWNAESAQKGNSAEFAIRLDEGRPPVRGHFASSGKEPRVRFLYTWDLAKMLVKIAGESKPGSNGDKPSIDREVLLGVARNLEGIQKRKAERKPRDGVCHCVVGLNKLVNLLSQSESMEVSPVPMKSDSMDDTVVLDLIPRASGEAPPPSLEIEEVDLRSEITLPKLLKKNQLTREDIWIVEDERASPEEKPVVSVEGRIANAGLHDYCIVWPAGQVAEIKVGELIGIHDQEHSLFIGVIRWLHCGEGRVRFGVELLTLSAGVVELLDGDMKPMAKGLYLPPEWGLRSTPELLALPGKIQPGGMVRMGDEADGKLFRAQSLLKSAASFNRFAMAAVKIA